MSRSATTTVRITVDPLPPQEALAFWRGKVPVTPEAFRAMNDAARTRAFAVSGMARLDRVAALQTALADALEKGESLATFKGRIGDILQEQGWSGNAWRVENLFRTNVQQAYQAGRYAQQRAAVKDRPFWQYDAVGDRRTRPSHAALDGMVYPADHEFWNANYPPNGFRCRCAVRSLSRRQVEREGLTVRRDMPGPTVWTDPATGMEHFVNMPGADRGFAVNPGRDWLAGLAPGPLDDGAVTFPPALVLCRRGGPAFAEGDNPCRPPLANLDPRHILPVTNADILPRGLAPADYVLAFLKEFGLTDIDASTAIRLPGVKLPVVVGKGLFIDKATGDWKLSKNARDQHVLLLARTIKSPWEIWQVPAKLSGKACTTLRMIRLFRDGEKQVGGFGVCNLVNGRGWVGTTAFMPKADRSERRILEYLEAQRTGVLLYREP